EIESVDELHGQIPGAADLAEVEHLRHVGVAELHGDSRLVAEERHEIALAGEDRQHALKGDQLLDTLGTTQRRAEHFGHSPRADALEQQVAAEGLVWQARHYSCRL